MLAALAVTAALLVPAPPQVTVVWEQTTPFVQDGVIHADRSVDRVSLAHEVGHLLDHQVLTVGDRAFFARLLGAKGVWGDTGLSAEGLASPSEAFADYYSAAAVRLDATRAEVGAYVRITPVRLRRFSAALDRLGRRHGLVQLDLAAVV